MDPQAPQTPYSLREINLMFEAIRDQLAAIRKDIQQGNSYSEKRFKQIEHDMEKRFIKYDEEIRAIREEISEIQNFKVRALMIWSGITVLFGVASTFFMNKYFS